MPGQRPPYAWGNAGNALNLRWCDLALIAALIYLSIGVITLSAGFAAVVSTPSWKVPAPGAAGFLIADLGGTTAKATVCDTVANYEQWSNHDQPANWPGCRSLPEGTSVIVMGVEPKPLRDDAGSTGLALVRVQIPSRRFTGYLLLLNLQPKIPVGTQVQLKRTDGLPLRLAPAADAGVDAGLDLGDGATARVVRYDPPSKNRDLQVAIIGGEHDGKTGWVYSFDATAADGERADQFSGTAIGKPTWTASRAAASPDTGGRSGDAIGVPVR